MLDIKIYPNIRPLMDSAFDAEAVHVRFCIFTGHNKGSDLLVADLILPYLIAAWAAIDNWRKLLRPLTYRTEPLLFLRMNSIFASQKLRGLL